MFFLRSNQTVIPVFFLCFAILCFTLAFLPKSYVFPISTFSHSYDSKALRIQVQQPNRLGPPMGGGHSPLLPLLAAVHGAGGVHVVPIGTRPAGRRERQRTTRDRAVHPNANNSFGPSRR